MRFGQRVAADFFTAGVGQQEFFLLLVRSEAMYRIAVERVLHGENHAGRSAATRNLLNYDGVRDVVEASAALRFRKGHPRESQFCRFLEKLAREMSRLIELFRERPNFRFRKLAHALLQQLLFFRQFQVHRGSLPFGQTIVRIAYSIAARLALRIARRERSACKSIS